MARGAGAGAAINGLHFYAGLEITYNMGGAKLSSPQTTELRVAGAEGGGAAESTLMKWVHMATGQALILTALVGFVSGNWFSFFGSVIGSADLQGSYWYAKRCGRRSKQADGNGDSAAAPGLSDVGGQGVAWQRP